MEYSRKKKRNIICPLKYPIAYVCSIKKIVCLEKDDFILNMTNYEDKVLGKPPSKNPSYANPKDVLPRRGLLEDEWCIDLYECVISLEAHSGISHEFFIFKDQVDGME